MKLDKDLNPDCLADSSGHKPGSYFASYKLRGAAWGLK